MITTKFNNLTKDFKNILETSSAISQNIVLDQIGENVSSTDMALILKTLSSSNSKEVDVRKLASSTVNNNKLFGNEKFIMVASAGRDILDMVFKYERISKIDYSLELIQDCRSLASSLVFLAGATESYEKMAIVSTIEMDLLEIASETAKHFASGCGDESKDEASSCGDESKDEYEDLILKEVLELIDNLDSALDSSLRSQNKGLMAMSFDRRAVGFSRVSFEVITLCKNKSESYEKIISLLEESSAAIDKAKVDLKASGRLNNTGVTSVNFELAKPAKDSGLDDVEEILLTICVKNDSFTERQIGGKISQLAMKIKNSGAKVIEF